MEFKWEDIFHAARANGIIQFNTSRAKVEGGWLITHSLAFKDKVSTSTCFMPDENHEWEIDHADENS